MEGDIIEESKPKRIVTLIIALFLFFLIIGYFLLSYPLYSVLGSLSESKLIENNTISLNKNSIIFTNNTYQELVNHYLGNQKVEVSLCLMGEIAENYLISELYYPEIIEQSFGQVIFKSCPRDTIIMLHSHPYKKCIASNQDLKTLKNIRKSNQQIIMLIMCEKDRFSVY
jgi:hypothetical protein